MQSIDRLFGQANEARQDGRYTDARANLDTLITIARRQADDILRAQALTIKAQVECDDDRAVAAVPLYEEAVTLYRKTSDVLALAATLRYLGDAYQTREDYDEASSRYEEALTIYRALGEGAVDVPPYIGNDIHIDANGLQESLAQCRRGWPNATQTS